MEENVKLNEAEDQRCLAKVEELLEAGEYVVYFFHPFLYLFTSIDWLFVYIPGDKKGVPVVGMIVEPIQSEGGDHHGSNAWFQVC